MNIVTTGWGYYQQGSDQLLEVDELGSYLSRVIGCPVHWPAWGKNLFECRCGILFYTFQVRSRDGKLLNDIHGRRHL